MKQELALPIEVEKPKRTPKMDEKTLADLPGAGAATIEKLELAGFADLMAVAVATPGELIDASGVGEAVAKRMIAAARSMLDMGFSKAVQNLLSNQYGNSKLLTSSILDWSPGNAVLYSEWMSNITI